MGLDDALRRERAKAVAAAAATEADASLVARLIPVALSKIRSILEETLTHLPLTHPMQVLRVVRANRIIGTHYEVADHLWPLGDKFLFGDELSIYHASDVYYTSSFDTMGGMRRRRMGTPGTFGIRTGRRHGDIDAEARVLKPDADAVDLSHFISVHRGEAKGYSGTDLSTYSMPGAPVGPRKSREEFSVTSDGSIYVKHDEYESSEYNRLEDFCAQLVVKATT